MTQPSAWLRDLVAYSLQLALLVAAAGLLARLLPLRPPRVALLYWQALLLACLTLPLGQPRQQPQAPAVTPGASVATAATAAQQLPTAMPLAWPSARVVMFALAAGVVVRGAWIVLGLWRLRGLRRGGRPLPSGHDPIERAQALVGVSAEFYGSAATDVPITFGLRRPAVLLPEAVLAMPAATQQAIACHELIHVRRKDWAWAVVEECAKALLWFHPAIAWLVSRIQLVREQAVDRAVVALTHSREDYVGALLAVARARRQPRLVPAPPFLRRGRLKQRLAEILEEGTMSRTRLTTHLLASGAVVALALTAGLELFPLEARAEASGEKPIQVLRGGENLLHGPTFEYPKRARERGIEGEVLLEVKRDERGEVQDARVLSGPDELRAAALRSVLRWHYSPAAGPGTSEVLLQFRLPAAGERMVEAAKLLRAAEELERKEPRPDAERLARQIVELNAALAAPAVTAERRERYEQQLVERAAALRHLNRDEHASDHPEADLHRMQEKVARVHSELQLQQGRRIEEHARAAAEQQRVHEQKLRAQDELRLKAQLLETDRVVTMNKILEAARLPARLSAIHAARLAPEALQALLPQLGVSVGDTLDAAGLERVKVAVARFDVHLRVELGRAPDGGLILLLVGP